MSSAAEPASDPSGGPSVPRRSLAARLWRDHLARRWPELAVALACAAAVAALTGLLAWLLKPGVELLFGAPGAETDYPAFVVERPILWIPGAIVAAALLRMTAQLLQATTVNRVGHGLVGEVQTRLFGRLVRADLKRLRGEHSGAYLSSVLFDATLLREAATNGVVAWTQHALTVVATLVVMALADWRLTTAVLLAGPVVALVMRRYAKRTRKAAQGAMAETSNLSTAVMESLDGVKVVKIEGREAFEEARVGDVVARRQGFIVKGANARAAAAPATEAVSTVVTALVIAYAGWRAQAGAMSLADFMAFLVALAAAGQSLRQLSNLQTVFSEGFAAARRLFAALDVEPEIKDAPRARALERGPCEVRFEGVSFAYREDAPALTGVDLIARPGETVALVGPSGGGKSTILNLIPRFYDPTAGRVTVNGSDARDLTIASLRAAVAFVGQEPFLFDDTVRANIAYARPDASDEEVAAAAEAAAAHEFVSALPDGYDTVVGEAGARLSGGQRQRIAIARAFLKDAPVLLLDEATSALDTESEAKVQAALERLMQGRTTLVVAHRLSTVRAADRIYVIDAGRVAEEGTHDVLVRRRGLYARLAKSQSLDADPAAEAVGS
jgi:subfamily B ATP-binding cassette protein MsbA